MKKFLMTLIGCAMVAGAAIPFASFASSNSNCREVEFNGGTVCVNIDRVSSSRFELQTDRIDGAGTLRCDILLPDNTLKTVSSCNGQFTYNGGDDGTIKLWIRSNETAPIGRDGKPSSSSVWTYPQWGYDFSNGERSDNVSSSNNNNNNNNNNYNADNFYLTTSDSSPSVSDRVDLTVRPRDSSNSTVTDYNNDVIFKVYYRTSSSSSRVQTTSSSYFTIDSNYSSDYTDGIRFSSSRYGSHTFSSFIRFRQNYEYKVVVLDADDSSIQGQQIFDVGSYYNNGNNNNNNNNNYNADNFYVTTSDSSPSVSDRVDLTVRPRDSSNSTVTDYNNDVIFKIYYRTSSSSSRVQTTSSSYFTIDSNYSSDYTDGIRFSSSRYGSHTFSSFIRFRQNYEYKVVVLDADDSSIQGQQIFDVGSYYNNGNNNNNNNNYNADNFYLTTNDSSPSISTWVNLTVKSRDSNDSTVTDYNNDIVFKIYYRSSSSNSRVQTTSSSYFTIDSNYSSDYTDGIRFSSSRYGSHTFSSFIKFKQNYEYKVVVLDADDSSIQGQIIFDVGSYYDNGNSSNNNYDSINGFSSSQMSTVQRMYDNWNSMVTTLEDNYSRLDNSTARHTRSDTFYNDMEDILNDSSNRKYDTYDEFWSGFLSWSSYTVSVR